MAAYRMPLKAAAPFSTAVQRFTTCNLMTSTVTKMRSNIVHRPDGTVMF